MMRWKRSFLLSAYLCGIVVGIQPLCEIAIAEPNIVLIMADDLGWSDTSNTLTNLGNPSDFYETPMMERLAAEGMAFTNAYTNGPNCAPTRSALLTGQYAQRPTNNVYLVGDLNRGGNNTLLVGPSQGLPNGVDAIPNNAFTYAEMLQDHGYQTAHFGKFHVTNTGSVGAADIVNNHGFDENFGGTTTGTPGSYHASGGQFGGNIGPELDAFAGDYTQAYVDANIKPYANGTSFSVIDALVGTDKHVSDALADAAIDFMEREKSGAFLLQFNPYAVHGPIDSAQARDDLLNKYQNKTPGVEDTNPSFASLIEGLDQSVARLINYLETTPDPSNPGQTLDENTLVIFYSDNGGAQNQSNNGPLEGEKGELDEGGIRVPMIAWSGDPNLVDGGTFNHTPVMSIDFYKTFATISGAGDPAGVTLDGEDLSGIFADSTANLNRDAIYWHLPGYLLGSGRDQRPQSIIRSGDWKLIYNYEDQSFELFDLANDIGETTNVAIANPNVVAQLGVSLIEWLEETDAPLATLRSGTLQLDHTGMGYANGTITSYTDQQITISAGQEVPLLLDGFLNKADLDMNGEVNALDWNSFRMGINGDFTGLTMSQAFLLGDVDHDLDNDLADFVLFKEAYEQINGFGSMEALLSVPEPSTFGLLLSSIGAAAAGRRCDRCKSQTSSVDSSEP